MKKILVVSKSINSHYIAEKHLTGSYTVIGAQSESSALSYICNTIIDHVILDFDCGLQVIDNILSKIINTIPHKINFSVISIEENQNVLKNFPFNLKTA